MTKSDQKLRDKIERILDLTTEKDKDGERWVDTYIFMGKNEELIDKALKILWEEE